MNLLPDFEETGTDWEDREELTREAMREEKQKRLDKNAIIFRRMVAKFKRDRMQGKLAI